MHMAFMCCLLCTLHEVAVPEPQAGSVSLGGTDSRYACQCCHTFMMFSSSFSAALAFSSRTTASS